MSTLSTRENLSDVVERLSKVPAYLEPTVSRGGRNLDGVKQLKEDAKWLAAQLEEALNEIDRLTTPLEVA